ncbi:cupin domain-containing protein [Haliangium sp.]|uniref:cupin domain-containing protein n=1 Tax=Haliangium sp. TaxID=2663208 RepID=UPI003D0BD3F5
MSANKTAAPANLSTRSESFVDIDRNRNTLVPRPAGRVDESCLHRQVMRTGEDNGFSDQRGHPVYPVRIPSKSVSLSVGVLHPGTKTSNHRHAYESLIYITEGSGYTIMEGQRFPWQAGDALYVPPWCWHQHVAAEDTAAQYLTATNMPLLDQLGQTVLREEE